MYKLPFQIKSDIKKTIFRYKIIHNILPTKVSLFKAKICDDDICPQCPTERHSIEHMFLRCQLTLSFWNLFQTWWTEKKKKQRICYINREHDYVRNFRQLRTPVLLELLTTYSQVQNIQQRYTTKALFLQFPYPSKRNCCSK